MQYTEPIMDRLSPETSLISEAVLVIAYISSMPYHITNFQPLTSRLNNVIKL